MVNRPLTRIDLQVVQIPANEIAETLGDKRMTNMILLGSLLANLPVLSLTAVEKALAEHIPERHKRFLPMNIEALKQGAAYLAQPVK
jgi:2-oxoglutarate ferredoxin oxidoreductase subunit gamma